MEKLVNSGINNDNKCLGAYYVLSALTLVNNDAATSLYWLYEAAYHM
jgi:putative alpha-1,2-mannosidase